MNNDKPAVDNENQDQNPGPRGGSKSPSGRENEESRGDAVKKSGNKVHGDKLEGFIGSSSEAERANERPTRDDGDNDDLGELR